MRRLIALTLLIMLGLSACHEERSNTVLYLLTHPMILMQESQRCLSQSPLSESDMQFCASIVHPAAEKMQENITLMQNNPEQFGEQILSLQTECAAEKKAHNPRYQETKEKVQVLLAVASLQSPE